MAEQWIVPSPAGDDWTAVDEVPIELARTRQVQGTLFRKHILNEGTLIHPVTGARISIDDAFLSTMQRNFADGVGDIVQVPIANAQNKHSEDPRDNIGEVVGIERQNGKVYALIDARKHAGDLGKTMLGASAFLSTDYTNTRTGQKAGPTLLHVAVTNRPYVTGLEDYQEVVAATAADSPEDSTVVLTPEEDMPMTREEMLAALRDEHGIDVEALQAQAARGGEVSQLTAALTDALSQGGLQLSQDGTGLTMEDIVGSISELAQLSQGQASEIRELRHERAAAEVDRYIAEGRVLPKQREVFTQLALTNRDMLDQILPEKPVVALAAQQGVTPQDADEGGQARDIDAELAELTARHSEFFSPDGTKKRG